MDVQPEEFDLTVIEQPSGPRILQKDQAMGMHRWKRGTIGRYSFEAKVYDQPSRYGLHDGNISKLSLWITATGEEIVLYDREWIRLPPIDDTGDLREAIDLLVAHWILDNHRLLCGDSASQQDVDLLLDGNTVHLFHGDPPYNVAVESRSNNSIAMGQCSFSNGDAPLKTSQLRAKDRPIQNDKMSDEEFGKMLDAWFGNIVRVLEPGRAAYFWGGYHNVGNYPAAFKRNGLHFSQIIVWNKLHPVMNRKDFLSCYEFCFYCWKEGAAHQFFGPDNERDLVEVKKPSHKEAVHLTEKPVELSVKAISLSSRPGENVLELFGGSGSTLIGCEQTGRNCFVMEIDKYYCDVIVRRWENFTGKTAVRISAS